MHGHLPGQAQQAAQRPGAAHCARLLQHLQAAFGQRVCGLPMGDFHMCLLQLLLRRTQWPRHHEHGAQQGGVLLAGTFVGNGQVVFGQRLRVLQCGIQPQLKSLCGCTGRSGGRSVSCLLKALSQLPQYMGNFLKLLKRLFLVHDDN